MLDGGLGKHVPAATTTDSDNEEEDGNDHGGFEASKIPENGQQWLVHATRKRKLTLAVDMKDEQQMEEELAGSVLSCRKASNEKHASDHNDDDADDSDEEYARSLMDACGASDE